MDHVALTKLVVSRLTTKHEIPLSRKDDETFSGQVGRKRVHVLYREGGRRYDIAVDDRTVDHVQLPSPLETPWDKDLAWKVAGELAEKIGRRTR
jgi:hypothetical protein